MDKDTAVYSRLMVEADKALANGDLEAHARAAIAFKKYLSANKTSTQILRGSDSEQIENAFLSIYLLLWLIISQKKVVQALLL